MLGGANLVCAPFREPPLPSAIHTGSQSVKRRHLTDVGDQEEEEYGPCAERVMLERCYADL